MQFPTQTFLSLESLMAATSTTQSITSDNAKWKRVVGSIQGDAQMMKNGIAVREEVPVEQRTNADIRDLDGMKRNLSFLEKWNAIFAVADEYNLLNIAGEMLADVNADPELSGYKNSLVMQLFI